MTTLKLRIIFIFYRSRIEKVLFSRKHFYVELLPDIDRVSFVEVTKNITL